MNPRQPVQAPSALRGPSRAAFWAWTCLLLAAVAGVVASLSIGPGSLADATLSTTFLHLRAGRLGASFMAGAALGTAGVLVQGLFRNPLASPSVLGTTSGAHFGGAVAIVLADVLAHSGTDSFIPTELLLPTGCLLGALLALGVLLAVGRHSRDALTLLLTGFVLSSLFLSATSLLLSLAQETWQLGRAIVAFNLGGVDGKGPQHIALALPLLAFSLFAAFGWRRHMDLLLCGDEEAASLGVRVREVRFWVIIWVGVLTATAVSIGGGVGFVGLIVPHALRPFVGHAHGPLMAASCLGGGVFLVWCDVVARLAPTQGDLPLGVVTGFVGAPLLLVLLIRDSRRKALA